MFEDLVDAAGGASDAAAVAAWARIENAACARRLSAAADVLDRHYAADGSAERDQWIEDNWWAVAAEIAPAQNVSPGMAAAQLGVAVALRDRLPRVNTVFVTGALTYRMVAAIVSRTWLIEDPQLLAQVDAAIAADVAGWTTLSVERLRTEVDYWVDHFDPAALRRSEARSRDRCLDVKDPRDGSGVAHLEGTLYSHDADLIDTRLEAMAATVCPNDPRTLDQRRSDAMTAVFHGAHTLACACGSKDCPAAGTAPTAVVVHVVATENTVAEATPARLDGPHPPANDDPTHTGDTPCDASHTAPVTGPSAAGPGYVFGNRAVLPAPVVAATLAGAKRRPVIHPGDAPPERRRIPSALLAWFIRCRDLTCRFPGCSKPATRCDIDHTIPYPRGATQASNLKCLCRAHHLFKTFWGWRDQQHPDGTVDWISPQGQRYTTHPGSRLLFPTLCRPTAPAVVDHTVDLLDDAVRCLKMPRRKQTRAQNRAHAIADERRRNQPHADERHRPPPF
ncbi:DUF222 domain-containing protein [Mycobacterium sp. B14F4]|uniref:HNH endonuclease signature motif containing protein n=1 Tax=Mycobacterium sp. B14F4 TaxID=3153565 RepID=UPI00325E3214